MKSITKAYKNNRLRNQPRNVSVVIVVVVMLIWKILTIENDPEHARIKATQTNRSHFLSAVIPYNWMTLRTQRFLAQVRIMGYGLRPQVRIMIMIRNRRFCTRDKLISPQSPPTDAERRGCLSHPLHIDCPHDGFFLVHDSCYSLQRSY